MNTEKIPPVEQYPICCFDLFVRHIRFYRTGVVFSDFLWFWFLYDDETWHTEQQEEFACSDKVSGILLCIVIPEKALKYVMLLKTITLANVS